MNEHIEKAAKEEYENTHSKTWENASPGERALYYTSAQRIVFSYLKSLTTEVDEAGIV